MTGFFPLLVFGLHALAACGAILLAVWQTSLRPKASKFVVRANIALALSAAWAIATIALGAGSAITLSVLSASYLAWLWLLHRLFTYDNRDKSVGPVRPVIYALAFVELVQLALVGIGTQLHLGSDMSLQLASFAVLLRLLFCVGALVLLHNLYVGASQPARQTLIWPASGLAVIWVYDLNLYTIAYLGDAVPRMLLDLRALAVLVSLILFGLSALRKTSDLRLKPSRSFAFRSLSLAVIGAYLAVMVVIAQGISYAGSDFARFVQIGFVLLASALALAFLPSRKMRGWLRVTISKHLFQHRYDYRAEWLRFTNTIGRAGPDADPLHERAVQAVADITDSASGLLLTPREDGALALDARWEWPNIEVPAIAMKLEGARFFEDSQFILDLDDLRKGRAEGIPATACPSWLLDDPDAWAMIPLLHYERLVAVVVLSRPPAARMLDWEDFDLLRVVGRQLASYLAEQSSQDALGEAQRFDEFNRRIAFVMHDIKNLASQLSLLARNAEKHADKAEFRADMILTLRNSTDKLQALLDRLGRYGAQAQGSRQPIALDEVIARVARQYQGKHEVIAFNSDPCEVKGDAEALEQALVHLVQNAIEASPEFEPVFLDLRLDATNAVLEVVDSGCGMSPEFVRTRLFKPFQSSKQGGFGIGAYEARELVRAMGGRLDVESREGIGTRFIIRLPLSSTAALMKDLNQHPDTKAEVA